MNIRNTNHKLMHQQLMLTMVIFIAHINYDFVKTNDHLEADDDHANSTVHVGEELDDTNENVSADYGALLRPSVNGGIGTGARTSKMKNPRIKTLVAKQLCPADPEAEPVRSQMEHQLIEEALQARTQVLEEELCVNLYKYQTLPFTAITYPCNLI